jgi:hypothetical protein
LEVSGLEQYSSLVPYCAVFYVHVRS